MLSLFSCVWLFATPWTVSLSGSSVHGILQARILEWVAISSSRGSSWPRDRTSGSVLLPLQVGSLPLAPPGKPLKMQVKVAQSCPILCNPMDYTVHGILQARTLEWVAFPFSRRSSQPRDQPRSPTLQVDFLPAEPQGKPKNTGVGNLSLLQWIFPTQESSQGLLHCRQILYQLSYQGSPKFCYMLEKLLTRFRYINSFNS